MSAAKQLVLDRVSIDYGAFRAADDVSLSVAPGEVLGIVGESGSGKSTVARAIMGMVGISSGSMSYGSAPLGMTRSHEMRRRFQMVFQDPRSALNPRMTGFEILAEVWQTHPEVLQGQAPEAYARELFARVDLAPELLSRRPRNLSGGQAQRVAIARALAARPDILVCDEAVSALDVSVQAQIVELISALRRDTGVTIIFITHDLGVVRQLADRIAVMQSGKLEELAKTEQLFSSPASAYTRMLLGAALDLRTF